MNQPLRDAKGRFSKKIVGAPKKEEAKPGSLERMLREKLRGRGLSVSTNAVLYADGDARINPADICAARFFSDRDRAVEAIVIIDQYYRDYEDKYQLLYKNFLTYLFNRSPWKDCFITKDAEEAVTRCVSFNVEAQHCHVLSAQQVMRQFSEFPIFRETLYHLVKQNVSMEHATFVACYFNFLKGEFNLRPDTGHSIVYSSGAVPQIKNTFKNGILNKELPYDAPFKKPTSYMKGICVAVAEVSDKFKFSQYINKLCNKEMKAVGWDYHAPKFSQNEIMMIIGSIYG